LITVGSTRDTADVGANLRVRGIERLRVVDGSIMPPRAEER
jgi:choline dehydrogenase-like flavoprotein